MLKDLSRVQVLVKTFLRDEFLFVTVNGLMQTMPEVGILIVDDGDPSHKKDIFYDRVQSLGHDVHVVPFDSGFGFKSNVGIRAAQREYLIIGSDDFNFAHPTARPGVEDFVTVLDHLKNDNVNIAGGDCFGAGHTGHYEFFLRDEGDKVYETPITHGPENTFVADGVKCHWADLTRNYCMMRSSILGFADGQIHWDDSVKIGGGEHGAFFVDAKRAGNRMAFVPSATISEITGLPEDPRYGGYRGRARRPQRECFDHRGIKQYWTGNGGCDYDVAWMTRR